MVQRFAPRLGRLDEDFEILARLLLADEIGQRLGAQRGFQLSSSVRSGVVMRASSFVLASPFRALAI